MKIKILLIFLLVVGIFSPLYSNATSGACSYHGGVDCSAGPSLYGNAVCNDGWISSTSYYSTSECRVYSPCPTPTFYGATDSSICDEYQRICDSTNASIRASCSRSGSCSVVTFSTCPEVQQCRDQVANNNIIKSENDKCWADAFAEQNQAIQRITNDTKSLSCQSQIGQNSKFDSATSKCVCNDGYAISDKTRICESQKTICTQKHGIYAMYQNNVCSCSPSYKMNDQWQCIPFEVKYISQKAFDYSKSGSCNSLDNQTDKAACVDYLLHSNIYTWKISSASLPVVESVNKTPSQETVSKDVVQKPKVESTKSLNSNKVEFTTTTNVNDLIKVVPVEHKPSFSKKFRSLLRSMNPFHWFK